MMQGEARIILPVGADAPRRKLEAALTDAFGGFTVAEGRGAWAGPAGVEEEQVWIYDVAIPDDDDPLDDDDDDPGHRFRLLHIASEAARDSKQVCVYVRYGEGDVQLVTPPLRI